MKNIITIIAVVVSSLVYSQNKLIDLNQDVFIVKRKDYKVNYYLNGILKQSSNDTLHKRFLVKKYKGYRLVISLDTIRKIHIVSYDNAFKKFKTDRIKDYLEDYQDRDINDFQDDRDSIREDRSNERQ